MSVLQIKTQKFTWWHAAIILIIANIVSIAPAGYNGNEIFYNNFTQPKLAPPDWIFAPVWFFNNITSLISLYLIANMPKETKGRSLFIRTEVIMWILFSIFTTVYFWLQSPILGAIDTVLGLIVTIISFGISYKIYRKASFYILPRLLWLALATYVSVYVAIANKDIFFNVGPF